MNHQEEPELGPIGQRLELNFSVISESILDQIVLQLYKKMGPSLVMPLGPSRESIC